MDSQHQSTRRVRFGDFDVDFDSREIYRNGSKVKLNEKPFQVLAALVERSGQLVRRDELRQKLWPADTYVDFDSNVNTALSNLRHALGDSAENPQFIETVPRQGYRFIAEVKPWDGSASLKSTQSFGVPQNGATAANASSGAPPAAQFAPAARPGFRRFLPLLATASLVFVAVCIWFFLQASIRYGADRKSQRIAVFVTPFENLSGSTDQDYLSDGMTDEVITQLGKAFPDRLSVIARTTAMQYKNGHKSVGEIAREQHVDFVLEGTFQKQADRIRITAQFFRAWDEATLWTESFDRSASDLLAVEQEVANRIVNSLPVTLPDATNATDASRAWLNPDAYDDYLKGLFEFNRRTPAGIHASIGYFTSATEKDPNFAAAFASLAYSYESAASWNLDDPKVNYPRAKAASERALAIDKSLPEAHMATGVVLHEYQWDWAAAEAELRRTLELDPNSAVAHKYYAEFLTNAGRYNEALDEVRRAQRLDPLSLIANSMVCFVYLHAHRFDEAIAECHRVEQLDPDYLPVHYFLGEAYAGKRDYANAIHEQEIAAKITKGSAATTTMAAYYALAGRTADSNKVLQSLLHDLSGPEYISYFGVARIYMDLGNSAEALRMLEKAFEQRSYNLIFLVDQPDFAPLHDTSEFQQMVSRRGFPATAKVMLRNEQTAFRSQP